MGTLTGITTSIPTVGNIVDAVQVLNAIFVVHVLPASPNDFQGIFAEEQRACVAVEKIGLFLTRRSQFCLPDSKTKGNLYNQSINQSSWYNNSSREF